jgi:hypothetical protein
MHPLFEVTVPYARLEQERLRKLAVAATATTIRLMLRPAAGLRGANVARVLAAFPLGALHAANAIW